VFLTALEIIELTGFKRSGAQLRALRFLCIEHRQRADGTLVVLRAHVEQAFGLKLAAKTESKKPQKNEPNWNAI
jgi:hypothetical protein